MATLRREKGFSQERLAQKAGLTQRVISYYERESDTIPSNHLQKIAQALNVPMDAVLNHKADVGALKTNRAFLRRLEIAKGLAPKQQKIISDLIDSLIGQTRTIE